MHVVDHCTAQAIATERSYLVAPRINLACCMFLHEEEGQWNTPGRQTGQGKKMSAFIKRSCERTGRRCVLYTPVRELPEDAFYILL